MNARDWYTKAYSCFRADEYFNLMLSYSISLCDGIKEQFYADCASENYRVIASIPFRFRQAAIRSLSMGGRDES